MPEPGKDRFILRTLLFVAALPLVLYSIHLITPDFTETELLLGRHRYQSFELPLRFSRENVKAEARFTIELHRFHPFLFLFQADDCIDRLWINKRRFRESSLPFCDYPFGRVVDLRGYLKPGRNTLRVQFHNRGGPGRLHIGVAATDPYLLGLRIFLLSLLGWYGFLVINRFKSRSPYYPLYLVLLGGTLLRLVYFFATPYWGRAYDWASHLYYMRFLVDHFSLPPHDLSWQTHHPPLYHVLGAAWLMIHETLGGDLSFACRGLQLFSLLLSISVLGIGLWIAAILFWSRGQRFAAILFGGVLASHPGLIAFSSRINNDVLQQLFSFLAFAFLLRWWTRGLLRDWSGAVLAMSLGLLTKMNSIVLASLALVLLLLTDQLSWKKKLSCLLIIVVFFGALTGWFFKKRVFNEGQRSFVANMEGSTDLKVANTYLEYLTFNPVGILDNPFVSSREDETRRKNLWEFLFRSSYFGEFRFDERLEGISAILLLLGMALVPLFLLGVWADIRYNAYATLPLLVTIALLLLSLIVLRILVPYSSAQDFRYISLLSVPLTYYVILGAATLREIGQQMAVGLIGAHVFFCTTFILLLYFYPVGFDF